MPKWTKYHCKYCAYYETDECDGCEDGEYFYETEESRGCQCCEDYKTDECVNCKKGEYFYQPDKNSKRQCNKARVRAGKDAYYGRTGAKTVDKFLDDQEINRHFWD